MDLPVQVAEQELGLRPMLLQQLELGAHTGVDVVQGVHL